MIDIFNHDIQVPYLLDRVLYSYHIGLETLAVDDNYKMIIINSLKNLVDQRKIKLHAFVIMNNHIHLIWQMMPNHVPSAVRHSFMKYTAHQMLFRLRDTNPTFLESFRVDKKDRQYQFWKRNALTIELYTQKVYLQKFNYIHNNPVKAGLCRLVETYRFSSASYYHDGTDEFGIMNLDVDVARLT